MLLLSVPQTFSLELCFSHSFLLSFSLCPLSNQIFEETVRNLTPLPRAQRRQRAPIAQPDVRLHTLHTEKLKRARVSVCERMHVFVYVCVFRVSVCVCVCVKWGGFFWKVSDKLPSLRLVSFPNPAGVVFRRQVCEEKKEETAAHGSLYRLY